MSKTDIGYVKKDLPASFGRIGLILLAIGFVLGASAFFIDSTRAAYSYLTTYMFLVSIGLGSLFLIALEYLVGADWSTPFRRISEFFASLLPILFVLSIPLIFSMHDLFHWTHTEAVESDKVLQGKAPYLNTTFFIVRVIVVFALWILFYYFFTKNSKKQDVTKDQSLTKKNVNFSAVFIPLFAITITIASIDWMMSLEPHWFSTIFGVYYFAGTTWAALAILTLAVVILHEKGYLHPRVTTDHYYSLGTMLFAFTVFWGYISFSQYMLIWYADLPEETFWFAHRWEHGWQYFSIFLIIVHFIVPFAALLSYDSKTNAKRLKFMSVWILFAHLIDLYWLIMPNLSATEHGYYFSWMDFVYPIFAVGLVIFVFNLRAKKDNLVPIGDPKLQRGLDFRL